MANLRNEQRKLARKRKREQEEWAHGLKRIRERHWEDIELPELKKIGDACDLVYESWRYKEKVDYGAVLRVEGMDSCVIRLKWREKWIKVVHNPLRKIVVTVLPD